MQSSSRVRRKHYFISINNNVIYVAIHNRNYVISYIAVRTAVAFFFFRSVWCCCIPGIVICIFSKIHLDISPPLPSNITIYSGVIRVLGILWDTCLYDCSQFAELSLYFGKCRSVCLSAPITYLGVNLTKLSTFDPWRLSPRRHRVPIALTQTLSLSQTPPHAVACVLTSRI